MPGTILVVEDNELNQKLFCDVLRAKGYRTLSSHDGRDAVELTRKHRPDLILLDIELPDMSGLDVARAVKGDPDLENTPIVAVTAFAMEGDEEIIREGGCSAYLSKPISVGRLLDVVRSFTA